MQLGRTWALVLHITYFHLGGYAIHEQHCFYFIYEIKTRSARIIRKYSHHQYIYFTYTEISYFRYIIYQ